MTSGTRTQCLTPDTFAAIARLPQNSFPVSSSFAGITNLQNTLTNYTDISRREERKREIPFSCKPPDVKNGVGGLRDYQGILWMAKVKFGDKGLDDLVSRKYLSPQEAKKSFEDAYSFLLRVRNELHFRSKRPVDILHLEKQPEVALGLGYEEEDIFRRVESFMGIITRKLVRYINYRAFLKNDLFGTKAGQPRNSVSRAF